MKKILASAVLLAMTLCLVACGEEETTTVTGIVSAIDGTKVSLMQFDFENASMPSMADGETASMPEGMQEQPTGENGEAPSKPDGEMPSMADGETASMPEGMQEPPTGENGEAPSKPDGEMPSMADGEMPSMADGEMPSMADGETTEYDLANAHISTTTDGVKASATIDDITVGCSLTLTLDSKGNVTNVVISSNQGFGGGMRGDFDPNGAKPDGESSQAAEGASVA